MLSVDTFLHYLLLQLHLNLFVVVKILQKDLDTAVANNVETCLHISKDYQSALNVPPGDKLVSPSDRKNEEVRLKGTIVDMLKKQPGIIIKDSDIDNIKVTVSGSPAVPYVFMPEKYVKLIAKELNQSPSISNSNKMAPKK